MYFDLIEQGVIQLDDPISRFYNAQNPPDFSVFDIYNNSVANLSFHMLATHTSGLPRESPCGFYGQCSEDQVFSILNQYQLFWPPYTHAHYSNLGTALLGRAAARVVGISYENYVLTEILAPLGMNSSGFNFTPEIIKKMATGYTVVNGKQTASTVNTQQIGWSAPAGGMYTSTNDIIQFLKFLSNTGYPILNSNSFQEYILPGYNLNDGVSAFGLGTFEDYFFNSFWTITKGGLVDGFGCNLAYVPQLKLGIAAFVNLGTGSIENLVSAAMQVLVPALVNVLTTTQPPPAWPANYQSLLGSYGVNGITVATLQAGSTGHFILISLGYTYNAVWDPVQSINHLTALRYTLANSASCSCILKASLSEGVAYFSNTAGSWVINLPDSALLGIPKM